jgi:hypothetical protein
VGETNFHKEENMRKKTLLMSLVAALFVVGMIFIQAAVAQDEGIKSEPGWSIDTPLAYPESGSVSGPIITITGKVSKIGKQQGLKDFVELTVKAKEPYKEWRIWVGPRWFIANQKLQFNVGDEIEVRGLKAKADVIIGSDISKGDLTMLLRSESDGMPIWQCCVPRVKR